MDNGVHSLFKCCQRWSLDKLWAPFFVFKFSKSQRMPMEKQRPSSCLHLMGNTR